MNGWLHLLLLLVLGASVLLQFCASFFAFSMLRRSRRHRSWLLISLALLLMAARRTLSLYQLLAGGGASTQMLWVEAVALIISVILVTGLFSLAPVFKRLYSRPESAGEGMCSAKNCGLFENVLSGVTVYRPLDKGRDFLIFDLNSAAERMDRLARAHAVGRRLSEVFPGMEAFGLPDVLRAVWKTGRPEFLPLRYYQDARISGWRDTYVYRRPDGDVVAVASDATARVQLQHQLEEREKKFRLLYEQAPLPYQSLDMDGRILEVNAAWLQFTGLGRDQAVGRLFTELLDRDSRRMFSECLQSLRQTDSRFGVSLTLWGRSGIAVPCTMDAHAAGDEKRIIYCLFHEKAEAGQRMDDEKNTPENAPRNSSPRSAMNRTELLGELTGGIAKELNEPLSSVRSAFTLIHENSSPNDPHYQFLSIAADALERIRTFVESMYRFNEPVPSACEPLDINALLDNALLLLRPQMERRSVRVQDERAGELPPVNLPPGAVMPVLLHPLRNSLNVLDEDGLLTLRSGSDQRGVFVEIEDDGPGIPPDFLPRLFEPFTTYRQSSDQPQGAGLGLAIVRRTLDALGGDITVRSNVGQGTCVRIVLPFQTKEAGT
jgi:PAS domain S-box-containing protein